jgi:hypothetical protein
MSGLSVDRPEASKIANDYKFTFLPKSYRSPVLCKKDYYNGSIKNLKI